jgi:hypothetical protein
MKFLYFIAKIFFLENQPINLKKNGKHDPLYPKELKHKIN